MPDIEQGRGTVLDLSLAGEPVHRVKLSDGNDYPMIKISRLNIEDLAVINQAAPLYEQFTKGDFKAFTVENARSLRENFITAIHIGFPTIPDDMIAELGDVPLSRLFGFFMSKLDVGFLTTLGLAPEAAAAPPAPRRSNGARPSPTSLTPTPARRRKAG